MSAAGGGRNFASEQPAFVTQRGTGGSPVIQALNSWEDNRDILDYKENKVGITTVSK